MCVCVLWKKVYNDIILCVQLLALSYVVYVRHSHPYKTPLRASSSTTIEEVQGYRAQVKRCYYGIRNLSVCQLEGAIQQGTLSGE